jgi:VanZ family protein
MDSRAEAPWAKAGRFWGPVLLYMGLIFWSSSRERPEVLNSAPDYLLHGLEYAVLSALCVRALAKRLFSGVRGAHVAGGIAIAVLYGMTDEWHQLHVPGREGSVADVGFDFLGASLAGVLLVGISNRSSGEI